MLFRSPIQDRAHRLGRLMLRSILQKRSLFLQMEGNTAPGNQQAVDRAGSICPVFFSVSYFSTKIAVAISDQSIGIDLAPLRIPWKEIQEHLSLRERYDIETYRSDLTAEVCAIKWANKEALGKILGTGIALNPRKICLEKAEQKGVSFLNFCINGREPCVAAIEIGRAHV